MFRYRSRSRSAPNPTTSTTTVPTTITAGTHHRNRRCSRIVAGATHTTTRYTARNHRGPNGNVAAGGSMPRRSFVSPRSSGPAARPTSARWSATWTTSQNPRKTSDGRRSRSTRERTNAPVDSPRRLNESYVTRFENPPTKKKTGMTWKNQVPAQSPAVTPTALVVEKMSRSRWLIEMNQWPNTTATIEAARRKSTYRSRVAGVARAISSSRELIARWPRYSQRSRWSR